MITFVKIINKRPHRVVQLSRYITLPNIGWFLLATFLYSLFFEALYNLLCFDDLLPYSSGENCIASILKNFFPILFLAVMNVAIVFKPFPGMPQKRIIPKSILDLAVSMAGLWVVNYAYLWIGGIIAGYSKVYAAGTVLSNFLILLFVEAAYYVCLSRTLDRRAEELRNKALEYSYEALKSQVNPHFLFNSLNILLSLIDLDKEKSKQFTMALTEVYRHVLSFRNRTTVRLDEELELLRAYAGVLTIRYYKQLEVKISVQSEEALAKQLIPFSLQLLLENVTKHNEVSSMHPMKVSVIVNDATVMVINGIKPRHTSSNSGIGLEYINRQYKRFDKQLIVKNDGRLFTAVIPLL